MVSRNESDCKFEVKKKIYTHYKFFLTQFYMLSRSGLENLSTYSKRRWYTLQICTFPRLLLLLQLVLCCHIRCEKYWQPSHPRTHANNASIVKICSEQLV